MRQHLVVTAMTLAFTASAWSAPVPSGQYLGTSVALSPSADGQVFVAEVGQESGYNIAKVIALQSRENAYEEWVWDDTTLAVRKHAFVPGHQRGDRRMQEEVTQYGATISNGGYHINCADLGLNDCEMGLDARCFWTIAATADGFLCEAWGPVDRRQPGDPVKLQTLTFTRAK